MKLLKYGMTLKIIEKNNSFSKKDFLKKKRKKEKKCFEKEKMKTLKTIKLRVKY